MQAVTDKLNCLIKELEVCAFSVNGFLPAPAQSGGENAKGAATHKATTAPMSLNVWLTFLAIFPLRTYYSWNYFPLPLKIPKYKFAMENYVLFSTWVLRRQVCDSIIVPRRTVAQATVHERNNDQSRQRSNRMQASWTDFKKRKHLKCVPG